MSWSTKHSLTNLTVSFNKAGGGIATPDSEIVSNWSNISSDSSDNFIQLDVGEPEGGSLSITSPNVDRRLEIDSEIEVAVDAVEVEENIFGEERSTPSPSGISQEISMSRADHDNIVSFRDFTLKNFQWTETNLSAILYS